MVLNITIKQFNTQINRKDGHGTIQNGSQMFCKYIRYGGN